MGEWDPAGYQRGKGILYKPQEYFYFGEFDSVPHGHGVFESFKDKFTYEGSLNHGKIEGKGKIFSHDNLYVFEGVINSESVPTTGELTVNFQQDSTKSYRVVLDNYPLNKARIAYNDGREYEGYINTKTFVPEGEGTARYLNNSEYTGNWKNGEFDGFGKFSWQDGSFYEGNYISGKKQGNGRFTYASKKLYDGEWANGKQDGFGTLFSQSGDVLKKGYWKEGAFDRAE